MPKAKNSPDNTIEKPAKKKMGRPSSYNDTIGKLICSRAAINPVGLEKLCSLYDDLPYASTIKDWRRQFPHFNAWYLEAKSFQSQLLVEDMDDMIDCGIRFIIDDKGQEKIDPPSASLMIAKLNNRKWTAARLAPKIYGDRQIIEQTTAENEKLKEELTLLRAELDAKNKRDY